MKLFCKKCAAQVDFSIADRFFSNGVKHKQADCSQCGSYIKFLGDETKMDFLYFGKYKNKTIIEVEKLDPAYLDWLLNQKIKNGLRLKILKSRRFSLLSNLRETINPQEQHEIKMLIDAIEEEMGEDYGGGALDA